MSEHDVYQLLDSLHLSYHVVEHGCAHTIDEMRDKHIDGFEYVVKNLFVRDDKKKNYYLVVITQDKKICMKELQCQLNSRKLSFASKKDLYLMLKLLPGEVTPFGLLNHQDSIVHVVFDKDIPDIIGIHPLRNDKTLLMKTAELINIVKQYSCSFQQIDIKVE